jgi:hypothetical protein
MHGKLKSWADHSYQKCINSHLVGAAKAPLFLYASLLLKLQMLNHRSARNAQVGR